MEGYIANIPGQLSMLLEVLVAAALGGLIGIEREVADKPAGFRTLMIVAGASALLMNLAQALGPDLGVSGFTDAESRVVQAIVTGISFLGAGTIIRRSRAERVEGLTTAATILAAAGVGICVAIERLVLALGFTLLMLLVLIGFRRVDRRLDHLHRNHSPSNHPPR